MGYEKPLSNLSGENDYIDKYLNFQESIKPKMVDDYIVIMKDFLDRVDAFERIQDVHVDAAPDDFREYIRGLKGAEIYENGTAHLSAVKIRDFNNLPNDDYNFINSQEYKLYKVIAKNVFNEYGFAVASDNTHTHDRVNLLAAYVVCLPGQFNKDINDKWVLEKDPNGNAKFLAMMSALGLVSEEEVLNDGISNLGVKGIEFHKFYEQELARLKAKGYKKIDESSLV